MEIQKDDRTSTTHKTVHLFPDNQGGFWFWFFVLWHKFKILRTYISS